MHKVFVYGTLKEGYGNHNRLLKGNKFLGKALTSPSFELYDGWFPYVVMSTEGGDSIRGEVYEVSDADLTNLDWLEGYPTHYDRVKITVTDEQDDTITHLVWMYVATENLAMHIRSSRRRITDQLSLSYVEWE